MKTILKSFSVLAFALSTGSAYAAPDATIQADNQRINSACATDAQTASCGGQVVGKGLLICLHGYKKANPTFKFRPSCKAAMEQRRSDKKAGK